MGTHFFKAKPVSAGSGMNMESRAIGATSYGGRQAATAATKDIGAAAGAARAGGLKPTSKDAVSNLKGPKI